MTTSQMLSQLSIDELRERIIRLSMQAIHTNSEADREAARTYQQEWSRRYAPPSALPQVGEVYWRRGDTSHRSSVCVVTHVGRWGQWPDVPLENGCVEFRYLHLERTCELHRDTFARQFELATGPELAWVL
jgi:hypothetical protein